MYDLFIQVVAYVMAIPYVAWFAVLLIASFTCSIKLFALERVMRKVMIAALIAGIVAIFIQSFIVTAIV